MPHAPPAQKEVIENGPKGQCSGHFQAAHPGSYAEVQAWMREPLMNKAEGIQVEAFVQPWMLNAPYLQALVSTLDVTTKSGFLVALSSENHFVIWIGTGSSVEILSVPFNPRSQRWFQFKLVIRGASVNLSVNHVANHLEKIPDHTTFETKLTTSAQLNSCTPLLLAATRAATPSQYTDRPTHFFNGRLDGPSLKALGPQDWDLARYDFSIDISSDEIVDISGCGLHGRLINAPTRAVRGHDYGHHSVGTEWTTATSGFGAIHFHEDDLDDAAWDTSFQLTIPQHLRSGAYAVEIWDEKRTLHDYIVFFVRPKEVRPQAKTAFVFSTFTYLAYGNEHMYDETKSTHISFPEGVQLLRSDNYDRMVRRSDLGLAIYDLHSDGSGVVYSSSKRPLLNMRPDYVHWGFERPREFSADLLMVGFLEKILGDGYDILTDHDLHLRGVSALANYDCVITGSHPEYPSMESLDAYEGFAKLGKYLMYTGGNGFYWRSATDPNRPHRMEVRRADVGARTHELPAGERYHSVNGGGLGGLWRSLGRSPNLLFGIGSCASGKGPGRPFIPTAEATNNSAFSWLWKNMDSSSRQLLGKCGLAGGASGDELDRMDFSIGTPSNAVLLARSERHDDHFMLFNEELIFPMIGTLGSETELVRSDIVYYETNAGGAVFSVGSINWNNSLAWDNYSNDIAQFTENVLREFLRRAQSTDC
ncbi:N,N-dimethylformamidase beta subunit family domain-containing protein [Aspergillus melleus]|uniref:N,N-dimethylformamidase beta subunit family domain-containing protein n=1 Tax=Aspergillus melleus TaxID=138277 RepID=UPI001E8CD509|nr:uncharacterized protein LDX57_003009 [Aspergillus melleus]KAH8425253.1 hypothetical protein LDX57_003009 [Aspergillus melleus]